MKTFLAALLAIAPSAVLACQCSFSPLNDETARRASSVFVFQLVAAELRLDVLGRSGGDVVEAKIRVVEVIAGPTPELQVEYSTQWCCGSRLDVGHFYAAFLEKPAGTALVSCGNLLPMGRKFAPGYGGSELLRKVTSGSHSLSSVFGSFPSSSLCDPPRLPDPEPR